LHWPCCSRSLAAAYAYIYPTRSSLRS